MVTGWPQDGHSMVRVWPRDSHGMVTVWSEWGKKIERSTVLKDENMCYMRSHHLLIKQIFIEPKEEVY